MIRGCADASQEGAENFDVGEIGPHLLLYRLHDGKAIPGLDIQQVSRLRRGRIYLQHAAKSCEQLPLHGRLASQVSVVAQDGRGVTLYVITQQPKLLLANTFFHLVKRRPKKPSNCSPSSGRMTYSLGPRRTSPPSET